MRQRAPLGNAAMSVALSGPPELAPSPLTGLLAGQNLVGNQAVAAGAAAMPVITPVAGPKKPEPPKPKPGELRPKAVAPPARTPEVKDQKEKPEGPDKPEKAEAGVPRSPAADPKFQALKKDVNAKKRKVGGSHPPPAVEAGSAQAASVPPPDDREARGKAAHAEDMDAAEPKAFDRQAFVEAVKKAIEDRAPKNLEQADEFGQSGKAEEVKGEVQGKVEAGKDASAKEIADTTAEAPQPAPDAKQVVPMAPDQVPGKPGAPNPNQAAPDVLPASATDMSAGPAQVDSQMSAAQVTEKQLSYENSREPAFGKAVQDKKEMEAHSAEAPGQLRKDEAKEIKQVKSTAAAKGSSAMSGIHATRVATGQKVGAGKEGAKGRDEDKRVQVTAVLQKVFDKTKSDVEKILSDLDKEVDRQFTDGEKRARERFTREHTDGMRRYKAKRYGGWDGAFLWAKDKLFDLPEEANQIYLDAKKNYLAAMDLLINDIAGTVERELNHAKERIATGRKDLTAAVESLPKDLQAIGRQAATEFEGKFDELKDTVNDKGSALVDTLATKYTDAVKSVDEEIAQEKEKNKGLVTKAAEAIGDVIETIKELGRMLMNILRKAASAIGMILKDPIGFLDRLITGVAGGLKLFKQNAGKHLEQGVLAWLLGTGVAVGLQLPATFDVIGILVMIAALLGISWANVRSRLVRRVPEQAVVAAETAEPLVAQVKRRGVAGMWDELKSRVGDLKKDLISKLMSYLLPTIILAGITWIVSLFNPASAFIRACKMIIDIVRFIVTQAKQIFEFVNTVLDAVIAIARGGTGGVPALVERALARSIPVLIGALAAILGIGGIAGKVREIFQQISRPVNRAIDAVINKIVDLVKKLWSKIKPKPKPKAKPKPKPKDRDKPARPKKPRKSKRPTDRKAPRKPTRPKKPKERRPEKQQRKKPDDQDIKAPKRLVEPTVLTIGKVGPQLAEEIQEASDGKTIHKTGGSPKQVTKSLLARHRDAKYDKASRTLTLPKVSDGSAGSLSELGSRMASQTGVAKVTLKKTGEKAEIWGGINPKTPLAKIDGLPTDEAILRIAIVQVGIIQFLKNMAAGQPMTVTQDSVTGTIGLPEFETAWAKSKSKKYVKEKFRDVSDGSHEWIPTNYILEVTQRARDFVEGTKWIDLQNDLRVETFRVVYNPAQQKPKIVQDKLADDVKKRPFSIPQGHVGAVYYPTVTRANKQDTGSTRFHNELRAAFRGATTVKESASAAHAVAQRWVWDGSTILPDIHPSCVDKDGVQVTAARQAVHVASIDTLFNKYA